MAKTKNEMTPSRPKPMKPKAPKAKAKTPESAPKPIPNAGRCCTCRFYGKPCRKTNAYVPRKAEKPCYKSR